MDTTHEPLRLEKLSLLHWSMRDITTSYIWIIIFFEQFFKYGDCEKSTGYIRTNAEPLCGEMCSLVQFNISVNHLTWS
jgi:hypothetical protein